MNDRIVILDGYTTNPGDLDWTPLSNIAPLEVHDRTPTALVQSRAAGAPYILLNKTPLSAETIQGLPDLRYVGVLATGYNTVDIAAAAAGGITVTNVPSYSAESVAQHVVALILDFARSLTTHVTAVREGQWVQSRDWCFARGTVMELTGKTLGIIGLGRIGGSVARIGAVLGMRVIAFHHSGSARSTVTGHDAESVSLETLLATSDIVSLHCPLTPATDHMIDAERLALMKRTALLVNTSRGRLVDEAALASALEMGLIAGAALDVLEQEPPTADNRLLRVPNCVITPHIGWYAVEARRRLVEVAAGNLAAFLGGEPRNVVS